MLPRLLISTSCAPRLSPWPPSSSPFPTSMLLPPPLPSAASRSTALKWLGSLRPSPTLYLLTMLGLVNPPTLLVYIHVHSFVCVCLPFCPFLSFSPPPVPLSSLHAYTTSLVPHPPRLFPTPHNLTRPYFPSLCRRLPPSHRQWRWPLPSRDLDTRSACPRLERKLLSSARGRRKRSMRLLQSLLKLRPRAHLSRPFPSPSMASSIYALPPPFSLPLLKHGQQTL